MNDLMTTIPCIIVICYVVGLGCKQIPHVSDNLIPVIVGAVGGALGVVGMYTIKDFPAADVLNAIAIGISSGLASTGVNQIYKQLKKGDMTDYTGIDYSDDMYWDDEDEEEDTGKVGDSNGNE